MEWSDGEIFKSRDASCDIKAEVSLVCC